MRFFRFLWGWFGAVPPIAGPVRLIAEVNCAPWNIGCMLGVLPIVTVDASARNVGDLLNVHQIGTVVAGGRNIK